MASMDGVGHLREILDIRLQQVWAKFAELGEHNRSQDLEQEKLAKTLSEEIKAIRELMWSALKWLGGLLGATLLSVTLKQLGLL